MHYLSWVLKLILFIVLLSFAMQNTDIVTVKTLWGHIWQVPLVFIMLVSFVVGTMSGLLVTFIYVIKLRRELIGLRKGIIKPRPSLSATDTLVEPPRDAL